MYSDQLLVDWYSSTSWWLIIVSRLDNGCSSHTHTHTHTSYHDRVRKGIIQGKSKTLWQAFSRAKDTTVDSIPDDLLLNGEALGVMKRAVKWTSTDVDTSTRMSTTRKRQVEKGRSMSTTRKRQWLTSTNRKRQVDVDH